MQCHLHTMHSCLHAPILSNFLFFFLLFFLHSLASAHPHATHLHAVSSFFSFFFLYAHPHLHANTSAETASTCSCPPSNLCAGIYLVSFLFSSLFPAPFFLYSHLFFTSHLPPHMPICTLTLTTCGVSYFLFLLFFFTVYILHTNVQCMHIQVHDTR